MLTRRNGTRSTAFGSISQEEAYVLFFGVTRQARQDSYPIVSRLASFQSICKVIQSVECSTVSDITTLKSVPSGRA